MSAVRALTAAAAGSALWTPRLRRLILRLSGANIDRARIYPGIRFIGSTRLFSVGPGTFINAELLVGSNAHVRVGARVAIGPRCMLLPTTHELGDPQERAGRTRAAEITIGDGCWLGAGVTVLGGVSIGSGVVVAAGAVVTADCDPDSLYAGVPARLVKRFDG
ncbi:DapH/DapD/GlmU-related protein [Microbacterium sp. NPDC064584]|uniref:acyltransferase n=1 Tax=Microbacterium sp. NPDC064584 TaxID=3155817 RepID=UPI0034322CDC